MIEFGIAGKPRASKNLEKGMDLLRRLGLDATELQFGRGNRLSAEAAGRIGQAAADNGIKLSAHAPYFINFNSANPETVEKSRGWILNTVETADITGAYLVVVHAGRRSDDDKGEAMQTVIDGLTLVVEEMKSRGWGHILLGVETMGRARSWGTLEEIKQVCSISKQVVPVIDFAHVHALNNGLFRSQKDYRTYLDSYDELGIDLLHCHFTSVEYGEKGEKKHLGVDARDPDFIPLAKELKRRKGRVRLICESPLLEEDALKLKQWYEEA